MGSEANKVSAIAFMTEFSSGNRAAAWKRATADVTWTMNQHAIPGGERITFNRTDYDAMVDSSGNLFPQGIAMNFTDAAADGDRVFLEANGRGPLADGRIYANHYVFTFRFRGELISEIAEYLDTAYAQKLLAFTIEAPRAS
jgi:ketosteroid isomerase-like protein